MPDSRNSLGALDRLEVGGRSVDYFRISAVDGTDRLPFSLKVLLENLLRTEDGVNVTPEQIAALANWNPAAEPDTEIQFKPGPSSHCRTSPACQPSSTSQRCGRSRPTSRRGPRPGSIHSHRLNWSSITR